MFVFFLIGVGAFWGVLTLLGYFFTDKKCAGCKNYGDSEYMLEDANGEFWHFSCFPMRPSSKSPHPDSK